MPLTIKSPGFSGYHDYIVRSVIQSENTQAWFLARIASETARPLKRAARSVNSSEFSSSIMTSTSTRAQLPFVRRSALEIAHFSLNLRFRLRRTGASGAWNGEPETGFDRRFDGTNFPRSHDNKYSIFAVGRRAVHRGFMDATYVIAVTLNYFSQR